MNKLNILFLLSLISTGCSTQFTFHVFDAVTIRGEDNPTTQVEITLPQWPGDTFHLWLPEAVGELWQQWDPSVAHQDFITTEKGGLLWLYQNNPSAIIHSELIPERNSLLLETKVTNRTQNSLAGVYVQNCIHFPKAQDFICDDFSHIYIRSEGKWRSLKSLSPTSGFPRYYRKGFPTRGRIDPTAQLFKNIRQGTSVDHPLIVLVSKDGTKSIGVASEDYEFLFHNQNKYLHCIHSESGTPPPIPSGETSIFRQKIYFIEGGLMDCVTAFEKDIHYDPVGNFSFK
ncbi:MAG: hypothetical protein ABFS32_04545 [Bacteroidota bacterium]